MLSKHLVTGVVSDASTHTKPVLSAILEILAQSYVNCPASALDHLLTPVCRGSCKWALKISDMSGHLVGWLKMPEGVTTRYEDQPFTADGKLREGASEESVKNWQEDVREGLFSIRNPVVKPAW